jgi:tetratricopeptide (TPR) repeat protein
LDRPDDAVAAYRRGLEDSNDLPDISCSLATALLDSERYEDAETVLARLREAAPGDPAVCVNTARLRGAQGKWQEARAACEQALRLNGDWAEAHYMMGVSLVQLGRHDDARSAYGEATRLDQAHGRAHAGLAHLCRLEGDDQRALAAYRRAHKAAPDCYEAAKGLAELCDDLGLIESSLAAWDKCVQLRPDSAADQKRLGQLYYECGRFGDALRRSQAAVDLEPSDSEAQNNLAAALFGLGRYDEAAEACKRALDLRPRYATPHMTLAEICMERGDLAGAEQELRVLEELDGRMADDLFDALYRWRTEAGLPTSAPPSVKEKPSLAGKVVSLLEMAKRTRAGKRLRRPTVKRRSQPREAPADGSGEPVVHATQPSARETAPGLTGARDRRDEEAAQTAVPASQPVTGAADVRPEAGGELTPASPSLEAWSHEPVAVPRAQERQARPRGARRKGTGHLIVFSDPPGQGVSLDGVWKGAATLSLRNLDAGEHILKVGETTASLTIYKDFQSRVRLKDGMLNLLSEPTVVPITGQDAAGAPEAADRYRCRVYLDNKTDFAGAFSVWLTESGTLGSHGTPGLEGSEPPPSGLNLVGQAVSGDIVLLLDGVLRARAGDRLRVFVPRQPGFDGEAERECTVDSDLRIRLTLSRKGPLRARDAMDIDIDTTW